MAVASAFLLTNAVPAHAAKVPTEPRELARVNGEGGSYVVWLESPNGEVDVAVASSTAAWTVWGRHGVTSRPHARCFGHSVP
ncbi:hypothetical protein HUW63_24140 [Myxococcus sp. AM001]|nr:hypothetical protein [Myxococcus sp. AM001]